eukprot:SAG22_NODE_692_length_7878_cov_6.834812_9_plen_89_part_00
MEISSSWDGKSGTDWQGRAKGQTNASHSTRSLDRLRAVDVDLSDAESSEAAASAADAHGVGRGGRQGQADSLAKLRALSIDTDSETDA